MRLTVGPLPPAVYWRRRAVVLGGLLLVVIVLTYSCGGPGESGATPQNSPTAAPPASEPAATVTVLTPESGSPRTTAPATSAAATSAAAAAPTGAAAAPTGACTDAEMSVIPVPARTTAGTGELLDIRLRIKNISSRTCSRDVGADLQELRIVKGATAEKVWSSDDCGAARGTDVRSFPPNHEREYLVTWNGRASTKCAAGGAPTGPVPPAGEYRVFGRLGTKLSSPVKLTLG
jgi:hypothetical protein